VSVYREPPSAFAAFQRRWALDDAAELPPPVSGPALAAFGYAVADCAARAMVPLALRAQGFEREAALVCALPRVRDEPSARGAAQLLRDLVHEPTLRSMRYVHALSSAARAAEDAASLAAAAGAGGAREQDLAGLFGPGAALDMAAHRAVAGGAPRERVVALLAACFEVAATGGYVAA
jgi:hypothetical protein